jgi:nicotinate-nucleotide adenylyltransferase
MGGAFDPIHIAHLVTAEEALLQFDLDLVVFMPAGRHPLKPRRMAPAEFRHLLVSVATASHPRFLVSRHEIDRPGIGYTVDTLEYLRGALAGDARLFFITGADAVRDILSWKRPLRVLELCTLIAATRPGYELGPLVEVLDGLVAGAGEGGEAHTKAPRGPETCVQVMEIPALAISSSMIRERLASGRAARYLLPDPVAQLIEKAGHYRDDRPERDAHEGPHA